MLRIEIPVSSARRFCDSPISSRLAAIFERGGWAAGRAIRARYPLPSR
jgi:hypothetical protein